MGAVYLYTGSGFGKTTSALGLALRAVGQGKKVVIIQFMKGWKNTGEYKIMKRLKPNYRIYQFGRKGFVNLKNPSEGDKKRAQRGLEFAKQEIKKKPFILILDEINLAARIGLVDKKDVLDLLSNIPKETSVVLTGRYAPKEFIKRAEYVHILKLYKNPKHVPATRGIQY